jgi:nitrite reductase/ring-hydroxylating ferredoxin subunit
MTSGQQVGDRVVDRIRVATHEELKRKGVVVVAGRERRIAVFAEGAAVFAVENNCPHMGFPLDRGTVRDGMLTCHWHQARFDLRSGCTFDLWADDVARYEVWIEDGSVFVRSEPATRFDMAHHRRRLQRGMEQNVGLVQAKSILALLSGGEPVTDIVRHAVDFASSNLTGFSEGLTRLACIARLNPYLSPQTAYQGLYYAIRKIADEASTSPPRRARDPLMDSGHDLPTLKRWLRQWVQTRHRDGAERTSLTALRLLAPSQTAELIFTGATERLYADAGHLLEECNKAFELIELLGDDVAPRLVPLLMPSMTGARGEEESTNWHHPIELVEPLRALERRLPDLLGRTEDPRWMPDGALTDVLLGDDPLAIIDALESSLRAGAPAHRVARQVAYSAALRLARFAISNEVTDWFNPQHTFIYANGVYQAVRRTAAPDVVRGVFHGAISVYMDRYLNVPPARLPSERRGASDLPDTVDTLSRALLTTLDQRANVEHAADVVARYVNLDLPFGALVDTLTLATVREDLDFHSLQVLEAAVNQGRAWADDTDTDSGAGRRAEPLHILVGVARNLAAHCPTRRAGQQTAEIAQRLHRGERVFEESA